jgi:hypothetical protein
MPLGQAWVETSGDVLAHQAKHLFSNGVHLVICGCALLGSVVRALGKCIMTMKNYDKDDRQPEQA